MYFLREYPRITSTAISMFSHIIHSYSATPVIAFAHTGTLRANTSSSPISRPMRGCQKIQTFLIGCLTFLLLDFIITYIKLEVNIYKSVGGVSPKCLYPSSVTVRPRGVRSINPICMRYGSLNSSIVASSSESDEAIVLRPTGPPPNL